MRKIILSALALLTIAATSCQKDKKVTSSSGKEPNVKMKTIDFELLEGPLHNAILDETVRQHPTILTDTTIGIYTMTKWAVNAYDTLFNATINADSVASYNYSDLSALHVLDANGNLLPISLSFPTLEGAVANSNISGALHKIHTYTGYDFVDYATEQMDIEDLTENESLCISGYLSVLQSSSQYWGGNNDTTRYLFRTVAEADAYGYSRGFLGYFFLTGDIAQAKIHGGILAAAYSANCKCVDYYQ